MRRDSLLFAGRLPPWMRRGVRQRMDGVVLNRECRRLVAQAPLWGPPLLLLQAVNEEPQTEKRGLRYPCDFH